MEVVSEGTNKLYNGDSKDQSYLEGYTDPSRSLLTIQSFNDYKPQNGTEYFHSKVELSNDTLSTFIAGMVFYNEDVKEIKRTLNSLGEQLTQIRDICHSQVIIVGDGVKQMHETTAEYLFALFCISDEDKQKWMNMIMHLNNSSNVTYVVQRCVDQTKQTVQTVCVRINDTYQYPLTLVLKSENRRKHNSQEWILNSFATQGFANPFGDNDYHSRYILMTDCGTLFESQCINRLLIYMMGHPMCVGTTARQRVMTAAEQDMTAEEGWLSVGKFLRLIQLVDYEVSYATYTGAFSAVGCLPVLPGPCALFRYGGLMSKRSNRSNRQLSNHIEGDLEKGDVKKGDVEKCDVEKCQTSNENIESALDHYNNQVDISIEKTNMCIENVKLAEDRIPSYAVITHGEAGAYTTWVDGAVFKFQAETTLKKFILQRRRWNNGALSCYVWNCLLKPGLILGSKQSLWRKIGILVLFWLQFLNYIFAMCTYGILAGSLYISLVTLFNFGEIALLITLIYGSLMLTHLMVHKYHVYSHILTVCITILNSLVLSFIVAIFIYDIVQWGGLPNYDTGRALIVYSSISIICIPLVMAIISLNMKSALYVILSFIPYWLFLPTLVGTFVMYSVARLSDITWGNRVSDEKASFNGASDTQIAMLKKNLNFMGGVVLLLVILLNVLVATVLILFYKYQLVIGIIMSTVVGVFVIQCLVSVIYFIGKHVSCQTCKQRYVTRKQETK